MNRQLRKLLIALLIVVIAVSMQWMLPAMASVGVKVNTSTKAYASASTSSASVNVRKGTALTLLGYSGGWAKVSYKGKTGYMPVQYLNTTTRYPAYVNRNTYVYASASTSSSRRDVSVNTKVYVIGISGSFYRVQNASGSVTAYIAAGCLSKSRVSVGSSGGGSSWKAKVVALDWYDGGSSVLKVGSYGYIYDIRTGITMRIKRMGGTSHADVEPATASDTVKLLKIAGGSFSWDSHAVILYAGGKYVACAINTMPHGDQTITNNGFNGQFCLHMVNSRTHGTNTVNSTHQSAIAAAYNWAH